MKTMFQRVVTISRQYSHSEEERGLLLEDLRKLVLQQELRTIDATKKMSPTRIAQMREATKKVLDEATKGE